MISLISSKWPSGFAEEATDLAAAVGRWRQELSATRLEHLIRRTTIGDAHGQLVTDSLGVTRRRERDGRLIVGRATSRYEQEPAALELEHRRGAPVLPEQLCAKHIRIERSSPRDVLDDEQDAQLDALYWKLI